MSIAGKFWDHPFRYMPVLIGVAYLIANLLPTQVCVTKSAATSAMTAYSTVTTCDWK